MENCPNCGQETEGSTHQCPSCETALEGATESECTGDSGVSRRGLLVYSGGSALVTWAGVAAGWFVFIREPTGPEEDVVRAYVDALDRQHFYTAESLFHERAPGEAWGPTDLPTIDRITLTVEETDVVDRETEPQIEGVEELALVHADISIDDGDRSERLEVAFVVALNEDGEWRLWEDR